MELGLVIGVGLGLSNFFWIYVELLPEHFTTSAFAKHSLNMCMQPGKMRRVWKLEVL